MAPTQLKLKGMADKLKGLTSPKLSPTKQPKRWASLLQGSPANIAKEEDVITKFVSGSMGPPSLPAKHRRVQSVASSLRGEQAALHRNSSHIKHASVEINSIPQIHHRRSRTGTALTIDVSLLSLKDTDSDVERKGLFIPEATIKTQGVNEKTRDSILAQCQVPIPETSGCRREDFRPGMLIEAPLFGAHANKQWNEDDERQYVVHNDESGWIYVKRRPFVILMTHFDSFFAVPMFTHSGHGLDKIAMAKRHEFVYVYSKHGGTPRTDHIHKSIAVERSRFPMRHESSIWLAGGTTKSYKDPNVEITGELSRAALAELLTLWMDIMVEASEESRNGTARLSSASTLRPRNTGVSRSSSRSSVRSSRPASVLNERVSVTVPVPQENWYF